MINDEFWRFVTTTTSILAFLALVKKEHKLLRILQWQCSNSNVFLLFHHIIDLWIVIGVKMESLCASKESKVLEKSSSSSQGAQSKDQIIVPLQQRHPIWSLSFDRETLHHYLSRGLLAHSTSSVKPKLTPENTQLHKDYCQGIVKPDGCFSDLMMEVHVDEKGFDVMQVQVKFTYSQMKLKPKSCYIRPASTSVTSSLKQVNGDIAKCNFLCLCNTKQPLY